MALKMDNYQGGSGMPFKGEYLMNVNDNETLNTVEEIDPDVILLGPDQKFSVEKLTNALKMKGLDHIKVQRLEKYYDNFKLHSSTSIKKKIIEQSKIKKYEER